MGPMRFVFILLLIWMASIIHLIFERWRKSSHSAADGDCVQVKRRMNGYIGVRDSKNKRMPALAFTPVQWQEFVDGIKRAAV